MNKKQTRTAQAIAPFRGSFPGGAAGLAAAAYREDLKMAIAVVIAMFIVGVFAVITILASRDDLPDLIERVRRRPRNPGGS